MHIALALIAILTVLPVHADNYVSHGISIYGELKYGPDFTHFEYVNPDAPKGGTLRLGSDRHLRQPQPPHPQGP